MEAPEADEVPALLVAVAVNVCGTIDSPDTTQLPDAPVTVHVAPPGLSVTKNDAATPPEPDPAATVTVALLLPRTATGAAGTSGTGNGVAALDANDADVAPARFDATVVNVYATPFVRPVTSHMPEAPDTEHVTAPGDDVTTNPVGGPPDPDPAPTDTRTAPSRATTPDTTGRSGTTSGTTLLDAGDATESPTALRATAENVYD